MDQVTQTDSSFSYGAASFDYERNGDRARERLKFNLAVDQYGADSDQTVLQTRSGPALSSIATRNEFVIATTTSQIDYERPVGELQFLSVGVSANLRRYAAENALLTLIGPPNTADFDTALRARDQTLAAYGTHQVEVGNWTVLPGVRIEAYRREVIGDGEETDERDLRLFPTMHVRRPLRDDLDLDLSYSSRIARPSLADLDPTVRFIDTERASTGNPNLRPATTDAFEANLNWRRQGRTFSLTLFDRISSDIITPFTEQVGAVTLYTQVNAGSREHQGLQVIWRGPVAHGWRYSLTGNALTTAFDTLDGGSLRRISELEYSGNVQLEYRAPDQSRVGANNFSLDVRLSGPTYSLQTETEPAVQVNLRWRRRLTPSMFGVFIVQDVFSSQDSISTTAADSFTERTETLSQGIRLRLSLTYQWGAGADTMQDRSAPGRDAPS